MAGRIAAVLAELTARSKMVLAVGGAYRWAPVSRPGMFTPLCMRKRGLDGQWLYREPTEAEIADFLDAEGW